MRINRDRIRVYAYTVVSISVLLLMTCALADLPTHKQTVKGILEAVPELDRPVSYMETKTSLGDLVARIGADTGAPLRAAPDVADEPVAVAVENFPARKLLEQLAELLDYRWSRRQLGDAGVRPKYQREKGGDRHLHAAPPSAPLYEIYQDLASKQREAALRRQMWELLEEHLREEIALAVEVAGLTDEQRQRLLDPSSRMKSGHRGALATKLWSPIPRALAGLLGHLTPQQWAQLRQGAPLSFSTDTLPGEEKLSSEIATVFRASQPIMFPPGTRIVAADASGEDRVRTREQDTRRVWKSASGFRVMVFLNVGTLSRQLNGALSVSARAWPIGQDTTRRPLYFSGGLGTLLTLRVDPLDAAQGTVHAASNPDPALAADPALGAKRTFRPTGSHEPPHPEQGIGPAWRLRELLPDLSRTFGINFISDAYWDTSSQMLHEFAVAEPTTLSALLQILATPTHRWDRQGNLIRLRSRTWVFDRPREIPLRFTRRWKELYERDGALPLQEYATMCRLLSDIQLADLDSIASEAGIPQDPRHLDVYTLYRARHALRLYASLSPEQQEAVWQGRSIPVARMAPAQRDWFLKGVIEPLRERTGPPDLSDVATGSFWTSHDPLIRIQERRGMSFALRTESVPVSMLAQPPVVVAESRQPSGVADGVSKHAAAEVFFHFGYGPGQEEFAHVTVAAPSETGQGARPLPNGGSAR